MNYISKFIFMFTLISGTLITMSSSSWIGMWMGLELNLLSFIPLMISPNNISSNESAIKYFLIQAFASLVFLFSSIIYIMKFSSFNFLFFNYETLIINSSMMLKLGGAPFHFWFPNIIDGLTWINCLIILTWQKLAPLTVISYSSYNIMIIFFIMMSTLIGAIGGLNQTSLRKLLAFSSINHIGWLITAELYSNSLWLFYFMIYSILNFSIIMIFKIFNLFHLNQIFLFNNQNLLLKFCLFINFFSLGGLPPFLGFLPKWMIIENMMKSNLLFLTFFMVMMSLLTLFFYARLTFSAILLSYPSMKWNFYKIIKSPILSITLMFNSLSILFLIIFMMNNFMII
uniref:NADH-ubiquinone oxidoreductase chain 2 n=1 Tax=Culicoides arakawae TaxID=198116 RepID=A8CG35_CULAR|nr:NADH dehydrogenase subunit 2 [Culicoides arakawae]BAF80276.1 NADH dehydrogenase subunit 2 [Culicoides arakawae]